METPVDYIEDLLANLKHNIWGFVIYRSTYTKASDDDFSSFIESVQSSTFQSMEYFGADERPIAQQISWKVFQDPSLEGASKADIRRVFDEWCQSAEAALEQPESKHPVAQSPNARYRFCLLIDQASLESFKNSDKPWINIIMRDWPYRPDHDDSSEDEGAGDEEETGDDLSDIEGCTDEDVGWCKVKTISLLPSKFSRLCGPNPWYKFYQRPPIVV